MKQFLIIPLFSLLAVLLGYHSGATQTLSLPQILDSARSNNPQLQELTNRQKIASYENELVIATYKKPNVDVNAQWLEAPVVHGIGYDPAITNGANYSAVTGITYPLLTKDGKQTAITGFGNQNGLDNIPSSAVEKIEIPGRAVRYLPAPPQTRTSGFPAYGSSKYGFANGKNDKSLAETKGNINQLL